MNREILIRKFDKPTDIYICGCDFRDEAASFAITDDEANISITDGYKTNRIDTFGFVTILTAQELIDLASKMDDPFGQIQFIEDYVGDIKLVIPPYCDFDFIEDFDISEYYMYQVTESESGNYDSNDVVLQVDKHPWSSYLYNEPFEAKIIQNLLYKYEDS